MKETSKQAIKELVYNELEENGEIQKLWESAKGKSKIEKLKIAKEITLKFIMPMIMKADVKELIEKDFANYFQSKVEADIDIRAVIGDLVSSGFKAGMTECKNYRLEDGTLDWERAEPVVQRLYKEISGNHPAILTLTDKIQEQLQTSILFSMRAAVEKYTKGRYLDLMLDEELTKLVEDDNAVSQG